MNKIWVILQREYLTRVRKKTFLLLTFLTPLLLAGIMVVPTIIMATTESTDKVMVVDESGLFKDNLRNSDNLVFEFSSYNLDKAKNSYEGAGFDKLLYIPKQDINNPGGVELYSSKSAGIKTVSKIETRMKDHLENLRLEDRGIDKKLLKGIRPSLAIETFTLDDGEEEAESSSAIVSAGAGFVAGFLIYFAIFLYGSQVMRGVIEEKTNRVVEIIVSSVRPFELMMGKVLGVAMVGLTQFFLWIILTVIVYSVVGGLLFSQMDMKKVALNSDPTGQIEEMQQKIEEDNVEVAGESKMPKQVERIMKGLGSINYPRLIGVFLFYFIGGFFLYGALFAAVGSAVDNEVDAQQFTLPISAPLILAIIVAQSIVADPESQLGFWLSIFPLTSPVVMMVRLPFGVPDWQLALSMVLLFGSFLGTIWLAAKIYRVGILMYGKKPSYQELAKWIFYK